MSGPSKILIMNVFVKLDTTIGNFLYSGSFVDFVSGNCVSQQYTCCPFSCSLASVKRMVMFKSLRGSFERTSLFVSVSSSPLTSVEDHMPCIRHLAAYDLTLSPHS